VIRAGTRRGAISVAIALAIAAAACTPSTSSSQRLPIGSACATSGQCGTGAFYCDLGWPSGYCKVPCSGDAGCPGGTVCVGAGMLTSGACLVPCQVTSDCRKGYVCLGDSTSSHLYCAAPPMTDGATRD
jgi:hypothetical protein